MPISSPTATAMAKPARVVMKVWVACIMMGSNCSTPTFHTALGAGSRNSGTSKPTQISSHSRNMPATTSQGAAFTRFTFML